MPESPVSREPRGCAEVLRVLADPTRLAVVRRLIAGARHVGEINAEIGCEQTLLSHHLRVLRDAGIVEAHRDGKAVLYRLAAHVRSQRRQPTLELGCCHLTFAESA